MTDDDIQPTYAAGWYPDVHAPGTERYYDGSKWTNASRAVTAAEAPSGDGAVFSAQGRSIAPNPARSPAPRGGSPARPRTALAHWVRGLPLSSWLWAGLIVLFVIVGAFAGGLGGMLMMVGLIGIATGLYSLLLGRPSWARIAKPRTYGAIVLGTCVVITVAAVGIGSAHSAAPAETAAEASPTSAATPTVTLTPESTPTPTGEPDAPDETAAAASGPAVAITDSSALPATAVAALEILPVKGRAPKTGYDRTAMFGTAWLDVDHNGCDTRNDILARDLTDKTLSGTCKVMSGTLLDPYTADSIAFVRGNTTSLKVQIDHVVALMDAWQSGAQQLTEEQRISLANDPTNLLAVDGPTNAQKGDSNAASWLPPNRSFRCEYVARQISVKVTYGLWIIPAEKAAMARVLSTCPDQVTYPSTSTPTPVTAAPAPDASAPAVQPAPPVYYANCTAVRAAGAAPIYAGQPGYSLKLDRDGDGVACE